MTHPGGTAVAGAYRHLSRRPHEPVAPGRRVVLFVHAADEWYGSDYVLWELVGALRDTEFVPVVVVPDDVASELAPSLRLSDRLEAAGVRVYRQPLTVLRRRYMNAAGALRLAAGASSATRGVLDLVRAVDVALVHSHTAAVHTGARVARALGVPHLWHVSEIVHRPHAVAAWLARTIDRHADRVITVSRAVREHLLGLRPELARKSDVIHNGVDVRRFTGVDSSAARARLSPDGAPVIGLVGRIGTFKGQELLLRAMSRVKREVPEARAALIGGVLQKDFASVARLRELASRYALGDRVVIHGFEGDIAAHLAAMDVIVQPSLRPDPLPTTVLEAMASGKPVVAAESGGAPEMVVDGATGILFPAGDADALAAALVRLLRDPELRERMGRLGRERVEQEFSPGAFRDAYLREYRTLAAERARRER